MIETSRRSLLTGLGAIIAAPAIVRASSLMPISPMEPELQWLPLRPMSFIINDHGCLMTGPSGEVILSTPGVLERIEWERGVLKKLKLRHYHDHHA